MCTRRARDELMINDGVARATRMAREGPPMTRAHQKRLAKVIEQLTELHPDWRIGQLVANVAAWASGPTAEAVWDVDDESFLKAAETHLRTHASQKSPPPQR